MITYRTALICSKSTDRERRHRLYEKQARREEMADIESEEERIKERWKNLKI